MKKNKNKKKMKVQSQRKEQNLSAMSMAMSQTSSSSTPSTQLQTKMSAMQLLVSFVIIYFINAGVIYLANMFFPDMVVLGNHALSPIMGMVISGTLLALVTVAATPLIERAAEAQRTRLSDSHWMILFFVINTLAVWTIARFAEAVGFGISSWIVAVALALILDVLQGLAVKAITSTVK